MSTTCIGQRAKLSRYAAATLVLAVMSVSWGQVFQEREGRALDANPLVGSGGSNTPVRGYVPINGNQIMTGNVTGLGYFHGRVPYSSTTEFSGRLGSADLRNFARQSAGAPGGATYTGGYATYYLPSQTVSTSQGRINPGSLSGMDARMVGPGSINPTSSARSTGGYGQSTIVAAPAPAEAQVPIRNFRQSYNNDDIVGSRDTNSLFGWRDVRQQGQAMNADIEGGIRPAARAGEEDFVVRPGQTKSDGIKKSDGKDSSSNPEMPRDEKDQADDAPGGIGRVGSQVDGRLKSIIPVPGEAVKPERNLDDSLKATRDSKPGDLQGGIHSKDKQAAMSTPANDSPAVAMAKAELAKYQSADPSLPNYRTKQWIDNRLREAQAQSYVPAVTVPVKGADAKKTPAVKRGPGREPSSINDMMNLADTQMRAGRFIQAANTYQGVMIMDGGYTPAMFGRAHAEIAAGFYESAAYDLRFLFDRYPDLATFKSDLRRYMGDRVNFVISDLAELSKKSPKGSVGFLLAYCYYQTGQTDLLKAHVTAWGEAAPGDRWQRLAAEQWANSGKQDGSRK